MTMLTTTGTAASSTITVLSTGETIMVSNDAWSRLFRALADLYLDGEIAADTLNGEITSWIGNGPRLDYLREHYPAAKHLEGRIALAMMEPDCLCNPYREEPWPCGCVPMDRRERLLELIGSG